MRPRHAPERASRAYTPKQPMTHKENHTAAFMKVATAPLATLTYEMLGSIAASHAKRGTREHVVLYSRLVEQLAERREREGHGG